MGAKGDRRLIESFSKDASLAEAFEFLFENASDAIYILDKHGKFVAVNREAEELTGFKREEWIGKSFRKIIATKSLPKAVEAFLNVIRGKSIKLELELKTAFHKNVLVEVTSKPLIINGKTVGTLGIARDINFGVHAKLTLSLIITDARLYAHEISSKWIRLKKSNIGSCLGLILTTL